MLDICLTEILRGLELKAGWILLGSQHDRRLELAAAQGVSRPTWTRSGSDGLSECLCREVFWTGHRMQARNTTSARGCRRSWTGLAEPVAHACIPLRMHGAAVRGVLNVAARPDEQFGDDELRFLETLGHQLCVAVERAEHLPGRARAQPGSARDGGDQQGHRRVARRAGGARRGGQSALEVLGADRVQIFLGGDPRKLTVAHLSGLPAPGAARRARPWTSRRPRAPSRRARSRSASCVTVDDWARDQRVNRELAERWSIGSRSSCRCSRASARSASWR